MKALVVVAIGLLATSLAFANPSIEWTSETVPAEIRDRVAETVRAQCGAGGDNLRVSESAASAERIDQGVVDYFYSITLSTMQASNGKSLGEVPAVQVEVAHYSFSNPGAGDPISVAVQGLEAGFCK